VFATIWLSFRIGDQRSVGESVADRWQAGFVAVILNEHLPPHKRHNRAKSDIRSEFGNMTGLDAGKTERRLESWKEIAVFFDRDEKTVRRWEKDLGLPVHRLPGVSKGRVYAFAQELSEWSERPRSAKAEAASESDPELELVVAELNSVAPPEIPPAIPAPQLKSDLSLRFAVLAAVIVFGVAGMAFRFHTRGFSLAALGIASQTASANVPAHRPNPEAERLYLEGRYYWNERTAAGLTRALDDFTQAIVADPQCAKAYAGLADSYNLIREYTAMPEDEAFPRAEAAARKAIELDPNLAEAHRALAFPSFWWKRDVPTAKREFERAIALNPNDGTAHLWYANALIYIGDNDKAIAEINRAQELDPSSSSVRADKGKILYSAGKKDEALALLRQMKRNEPTFVSPHRYLAQIYFEQGDYPEYLLEAEETARLVHRPDDLAEVEAEKRGYARDGARGFFQSRLDVQKDLYEKEKLPAYTLAQTAAMLGNKSEALQYLMTSRDRHESVIAGLARDGALSSLHDDPGYKKLVAEVGFPPLN
jgi:tetratricopeptide (TPR) repeat protein